MRTLSIKSAAVLILSFGLARSTAFASPQCHELFDSRIAIVHTDSGSVTLKDPEAVQFYNDLQELNAIAKLAPSERRKSLVEFTAQYVKPRSETALVFANYLMALWVGSQVAMGLHADPGQALNMAVTTGPLLVAADFISAGFHKFLDSFASEKNKIWGGAARAFRLHHEYANNLNPLSYLQNVAAFGQLMFPLYMAESIAAPHLSATENYSALMLLLLFSNGTEIHRQAHLPKSEISKSVGFLQKIKFLLSPKDHALHHKKPMDQDFGIINGISNKPTRALWKSLDRLFWRVSQRMPNNWIQHPESIPPDVVQEILIGLNDIDASQTMVSESLIVSLADKKKNGELDSSLDEILETWIERFGDQNENADDN